VLVFASSRGFERLIGTTYRRNLGEEWARVFGERVEVEVVDAAVDGVQNTLE
jgi:hypothetical protein